MKTFEDNKEEIDRIIKLLNEYTVKLKSLLNLYQAKNRRRLMMLLIFSTSFVTMYGFTFFYFQLKYDTQLRYDTSYETQFILGFIIFSVFILLMFFMYTYLNESRNKRDISDEMMLIKNQLKQLIEIGSQAREHLINRDSFALLEIDLKLVEAEDIINRSYRIVSVRNIFEKQLKL